MKFTVFGAGSYGTALATVAARAGHDVVIFARNEETCRSIREQHKNPKRLSDHTLHDNISACSDMKEACSGADMIIHAIPAQSTFPFLNAHKDNIPADIPIISTSKGIYTETLELMSAVIPKALNRTQDTMAYLSGPSFAKDIMNNQPIAVVVASHNEELAQKVAEALSHEFFRVYRSDDVMGVEVGGALKNPLAIVSGMIGGMGYGPSTSACVVTRGCSEMTRLAVAMGGRPETLAGLSGMGDLVLTCSSKMSRNYTVGFRMAQGEKLEAIIESMGEVAEGVPTASVIVQLLRRHKLDLPLFTLAQKVLAGEVTIEQCAEIIMARPLKKED